LFLLFPFCALHGLQRRCPLLRPWPGPCTSKTETFPKVTRTSRGSFARSLFEFEDPHIVKNMIFSLSPPSGLSRPNLGASFACLWPWNIFFSAHLGSRTGTTCGRQRHLKRNSRIACDQASPPCSFSWTGVSRISESAEVCIEAGVYLDRP